MRFPWQTEVRAATDYDAVIVALLQKQASGGGSGVAPTAGASLEAGAGLYGRSLATARVGGPPLIASALTPATLQLIGRTMIRAGDLVLLIDIGPAGLQFLPATSCNVTGGPDPATWVYDLQLAGPTSTLHYRGLSGDSLLHFRYATFPGQPWRGIAPLSVAHLAGRLSAETLNSLADEMSGPVGSFLPVASQTQEQMTKLRTDLQAPRGRMFATEAGDHGLGPAASPQTEYTAKRFGPNPSQSVPLLMPQIRTEVMSALGVHSSLFDSADSAALREGLRQFLHTSLTPLATLIESELRAKLSPDITLDFTNLMAVDVQGKARSFQSMVGGGMDIERAAALSGLLVPID